VAQPEPRLPAGRRVSRGSAGELVGGLSRIPPAGGYDVEIKMTLSLPRDAASVPVSRQVLDGCLQTLGVTADTRTDIALALSEACANVIQHAGRGDEYEVLARARDGRCVIEVINRGGPAVRTPVGSPSLLAEHGRGIGIMNAVVDNLRLTGDGRTGTTVHFEKALSWEPDAAGRQLFSSDA
jgi:serine/threonine-protein kinase RsbW